MKRPLKILLILAAVLVALAGAAAVTVKIFLPPEKLKALAVSQADAALGRKLEMESVDFGLFTGLRIEGLRLSERPDFSKGEFLKADAFVLRFSWLPLLSKRFEAGKVLFQGLEASIKKGKDGQFNFSDLAGSGKAEPSGGAKAAGAPLALQMRTAQIKDSRISYVDERENAKAVMKVNDASVSGFALSGPFSLSVDVDVDYSAGKSRYSGSLKAKGQADMGGLEPAKMSADFTKFALKTQNKEAAGTFRFKDAASPRVEASLSLPAVDGKFLNSLAQGAGLPPGLEVPASKVECALSYAPPALEVSSFKIELAGVKVSGKASVSDVAAKNPRIRLDAGSNTFELGRLADILPALRGRGLGGTGCLKAAVEGTREAPALTAAEVKLELPPLKSKDLRALFPAEKGKPSPIPDGVELPAASLAASLNGTPSQAVLRTFSLKLPGLALSGKGTLRGMDKGGTAVSIEASAPDMDLAKLAAILPQTRSAALAGKASLTLSAHMPGGKAAAKASGTLSMAGLGVKYEGQTLSAVNGSVRFTQDSVDIQDLAGRWNNADFKLKLAASNPKAPSIEVSGSLSLLDLGALEKLAGAGGQAKPAAKAAAKAPYSGPVMKTSGSIAVDKVAHPNFNCGKASLTWSLTGVTPDFKRTDGTAKLLTAGGEAAGLLDMAKARGGVVRALVMPLIALDKARSLPIPILSSLPSLQNIPFTKIEGDYSVVKGVLEMKPFSIDGPVITLLTTGKVDLPNETTDLRAATKLPVGSIVILIKGPLAGPSIRPDISKQVNEVKEKGLEILQKQGGELLKRLFK
ncbi:MAG: AsmA family protein [Elusimicrobia bacterium]|nr:AsmA family protein [Elusimicrobiota bacterium]